MKRRDHEGFSTPPYPNLGARVDNLRRGDDRKAHGAAVLEAIRRLQRRELQNPPSKESRDRLYRS